jgi:FKBP-type peptidyl-prolyl cis-trans isomerase 2
MNTTKQTVKDLKGNIIGTITEVNGKKVWVDNHGKVMGKVISGK